MDLQTYLQELPEQILITYQKWYSQDTPIGRQSTSTIFSH